MAVRAVVVKTVATSASILFAGLVGAWFAIKIQQSADLAVPAWSQAFRVTAATVLFTPFLALIFLSANPRLVFKQDPLWGSLFFAGLAFLWLLCALFLSVFVGFGGF